MGLYLSSILQEIGDGYILHKYGNLHLQVLSNHGSFGNSNWGSHMIIVNALPNYIYNYIKF